MEQVAEGFRVAANWIGIPPEITPWELLNSELITAMIIGIFGLFLGRKVNRLSEKAEDSVAAAAYERELADHDSARDESMVEAGETAVSAGAEPRSHSEASRPDNVPPSAPFSEEDSAETGSNPLQSEASHLVNAAKKFVDERLDSQKDGRKRRKYENIGKRDYGVRVLAARDDGLINEKQALNLLTIFEMWRPYGTGRKVVTTEVIRKMKLHLRDADREKVVAKASGRGASKKG